jgi:TatD DNase family protein
MLIDTHTHLAHRQFDGDLPEVLERARQAGIGRMVVPATDISSAHKALAIADHEPDVFVAVGIHPCEADGVTGEVWIDELRALAAHRKVVAIGEIGLDYYHKPPEGFTLDSWKAHQARVLRMQLELAVELGLNVILHNRDSWEDLTAQLRPFDGKLRAVFHCFTGTFDEAKPVLAAGHLISFTGIVSFKNPGSMADAARQVPSGGYMLETDAPYLSPMPHRGKRCEPAYVALTVEAIARLRGETLAKVAADTTATARGFFKPGTL